MTNQIQELVVEPFARRSGLADPAYTLKNHGERSVIEFTVSYANSRFYDILSDIIRDAQNKHGLAIAGRIRQTGNNEILESPEVTLFLKTLAEIQNVNRYTFQSDFDARYVKSVSGFENQIVSPANHIVFGRRGSGKSTLLLYSLHDREKQGKQSVWIDMQTYSARKDADVILDVVATLLEEIDSQKVEAASIINLIREISVEDSVPELRRIIPRIRRMIERSIGKTGDFFFFLDDFHVVSENLQPVLLDVLYAIARGNRTFLKISAIENLTRTFETSSRMGLELPQDAQALKLDYNLTAPDKTRSHIESILDGHARYAGIPSVRRLCVSGDVISRLTWVSAGVPRDAISLFSQAIQKAKAEGRKRVTVSNVNVSSSETLTIKLRDLDTDAGIESAELQTLLNKITDFCVKDKKINAFLVENKNGDGFDDILKLVQLRLLHVISEGITVKHAGSKHIGLILDYGLYTGIRSAQSVELFNVDTERVPYSQLRKLSVFPV